MPDQKLMDELYRMRRVDGNDADLERFSDILNELSESASAEVIPDLCRMLEDDMIEPSAAGDLLETIFYIADRCGIQESMHDLVLGVPKLFPQGQGWAVRLHRMLLNADRPGYPYIEAYSAALQDIPTRAARQVVNTFLDIKRTHPELYTIKVDQFTEALTRGEETGESHWCAPLR